MKAETWEVARGSEIWIMVAPFWGHLEAVLCHVTVILSILVPWMLSWGPLGARWPASWLHFGATWPHLGAIVGPQNAQLGPKARAWEQNPSARSAEIRELAVGSGNVRFPMVLAQFSRPGGGGWNPNPPKNP